MYDPLKEVHFKPEESKKEGQVIQHILADWDKEDPETKHICHFQVQNRYIVSATQSGIVILDPQKARERIIYERLLSSIENNQTSMQHQLHPQTILLSPDDFEMTMEMIDVLGKTGFMIREFGKNTILIEAIPAGCVEENVTDLFESILEGLKSGTDDGKTKFRSESQVPG